MKKLISIVLITLVCSCSQSAKAPKEVVKSENEEGQKSSWTYPKGKGRLLIDSWKFEKLIYDNKIGAGLDDFSDSLNKSLLTFTIQDKGKFVLAGEPKIQRWGNYKVDSNFTQLTLLVNGPSQVYEYSIDDLTESRLLLGQVLDSLDTKVIWSFKSMGNKF